MQVYKYKELYAAAEKGDLEKVKTLVEVEHCNPLDQDEQGYNALHWAAVGGSVNILKYFVKVGYAVNPPKSDDSPNKGQHLYKGHNLWSKMVYFLLRQYIFKLEKEKTTSL